MDELLARLRAALRRGAPATEDSVVETLVRNAGKLVTQRQLLQEVWGPQYETRRKLEPNPARPRYFVTEARMGYRFES